MGSGAQSVQWLELDQKHTFHDVKWKGNEFYAFN